MKLSTYKAMQWFRSTPVKEILSNLEEMWMQTKTIYPHSVGYSPKYDTEMINIVLPFDCKVSCWMSTAGRCGIQYDIVSSLDSWMVSIDTDRKKIIAWEYYSNFQYHNATRIFERDYISEQVD
jgi:hypothetical protein